MGYGTSLGTSHEDEMSHVLERAIVDNRSDKRRSDQDEINQNSTVGDFQSRFYATDQSTMPSGGSGKLAGALKSFQGTGTPGNQYNTKLTPSEETGFYPWKAQHAPNDSGEDYDLRGAYRAGVQPDPETGHWPDTFKKPNHPTFSDQSQYATGANRNAAGTWEGNTFIPPPRYQLWPERMVRSAIEGIKMFSGKTPTWAVNPETGEVHTDPHTIEKVFDAAGLVTFAPGPIAAKAVDGTLGSFAGVTSKTLDKTKLYKAQQMDMELMHPDDIHAATGFFRGADRRWKYEINDKEAKLVDTAFDKTLTPHPDLKGADTIALSIKRPPDWINTSGTSMGDTAADFMNWLNKKGEYSAPTLGKVLDHPELYQAYPHLKNVTVEPLPWQAQAEGIKGMMSGNKMYLADNLYPEYAKGVILHELQHNIQNVEGFARGGNTRQFLPPELPKAEAEFKSIKAEVEPKIKEDLNIDDWGLESIKRLFNAEKEGILFPSGKEQLQRLKETDPLSYTRLYNISESERLLKKANDEAFEKYQRLMGEVEARNVQYRMNYDTWDRKSTPPYRTESRPRSVQAETPATTGESLSQEPPTQFRRAANENFPEGDPRRPYNVREPNMIGSKAADDALDASWKAMGERFKKIDSLKEEISKYHDKNLSEFELRKYFRLMEDLKKLTPND